MGAHGFLSTQSRHDDPVAGILPPLNIPKKKLTLPRPYISSSLGMFLPILAIVNRDTNRGVTRIPIKEC